MFIYIYIYIYIYTHTHAQIFTNVHIYTNIMATKVASLRTRPLRGGGVRDPQPDPLFEFR